MADVSKFKTKRKPGLKNFLTSPYPLTWPNLDKGDNKRILDGIKSIFPVNGLKRTHEKDESSSKEFVSWEIVKTCLVLGVNSVTKALEKDNLALVLVCRSTKPAILSNHLMLLSATRSTSCCAVFGLSEVVAPLLGMKTVVACGFKKNIDVKVVKDLVEFIACKIPTSRESYLELWDPRGHSRQHEMSGNTAEQDSSTFASHIHKEHSSTATISLDSVCVSSPQWDNNHERRRSLDTSYVTLQIKSLLPRETPKVRKKKRRLKAST